MAIPHYEPSPALVAAQDAAFAPEMTAQDRQHLLLNLMGALMADGWDVRPAAGVEGQGDTMTIVLKGVRHEA